MVRVSKRGPLGKDGVQREAIEALQNLHDLDALDACRLVRHDVVKVLSSLRSDAAMPEAQAIRHLLLIAVQRVYVALKEAPGNTRSCEFLEELVNGLSMTEIAKKLGISRTNLYKVDRAKNFRLIGKTIQLLFETLENSCELVRNPGKLHNTGLCDGCLTTVCLVSQIDQLPRGSESHLGVVPQAGFEPATRCLEGSRSVH